MRVRERAIALGMAATLLACGACKLAAPSADRGEGDAASTAAAVGDAAPSARCTLRAGVVGLDVGDRRALLVGEAIPLGDGFAVGLVRVVKSGPEALVARVSGSQVEPWVVARRAELVADAPPPQPLAGGGALYAAYIANGPGEARSRRIVLAKAGAPAPIASFPDQAAESLAFDAAIASDGSHAALTWDDDSAKGGIQLATLALAAALPSAPAPRLVSDGVTDVDGPRVAPRAGGGWWVAWSARREEAADSGARSDAVRPALEVPSEARAFSWVELVAVDAAGASVGAIRKLTSPNGHVASFDLAARPHGELDVFARDETQTREGEGGRVLHVVVHDATIDDAIVVVPDGAGRGALDLLAGPGGEAWLAYVDGADRPRLLPLGETRAPVGSPTTEDSLEGARLLAATGASRLVGAFPGPAADLPDAQGDSAPVLREVACVR
jgi:hypothetical protein